MPPDLAVVVEAWPGLSEAARGAVLRIVAEDQKTADFLSATEEATT